MRRIFAQILPNLHGKKLGPPKTALHVPLGAFGRLFCPYFKRFAQFFRDFVKVFRDFAQVSTDFSRIFTKSKLLVVRVHPLTLASYTSGAA